MIASPLAQPLARPLARHLADLQGGASWRPTKLDNLLQLALDRKATYTTIDGVPCLTPEEPHGTVRPPRKGRCVLFDGANDYAILASLVGTETATNEGTAVATVSAGRIDFTAGTCWNLELSSGEYYFCNEEKGYTAYDSSGNGNDITWSNIDQGSFHATEESITVNPANVMGYSVGENDEIVPAVSDTTDALGNALDYVGKCVYPIVTQVPCITGDGTGVYANFDEIVFTGPFSIHMTAKSPTTTSRNALISGVGSTKIVPGLISGKFYVRIVEATAATNEDYTVFVPSGYYTLILSRLSDDTATLTVNGVTSVLFGGVAQSGDSKWSKLLLALTNYSDASISYLKMVDDGTTVLEYTFQEGAGRTIRDTSGNGNHGTIVGGVLDDIWANTVVGEDWCVKHGGRIVWQ